MSQAETTISVPQVEVRLNFTNISQLGELWSPEFLVQGIPWKVQVSKENLRLAVYLHCAKKDKSADWSHAASVTFKLLPFTEDGKEITHQKKPCVFDHSRLGYGTSSLIGWDDLISPQKHYVKDGSIKLDVKIVAEEPSGVKNRSKMVFHTIEKSCDESTFRLTVTNVENLMAVQSPLFRIRKIPWNLVAFKDDSEYLGISLHRKSKSDGISCKMRMSIKLISTSKEVKSIEPNVQTKDFQRKQALLFPRIIQWDELFKQQNGFVNDNSIVMEVKIESDKPKGAAASGQPTNSKAEHQKMECSICLESIGQQEVSSTPCGHLYCSACIRNSIEAREVCPSCGACVNLNDLRRMYLPL